MGRIWRPLLAVLGGGMLSAAALVAQTTQTISARPGAVNYIEGSVSINNKAIAASDLRTTFLNANDLLSTAATGKAEVLLTPGVFLRVGENSEIRMVSPSLTDTQVELTHGEAMLEATGLVKDNNLQVIDHGSITSIKKNGLYRFTADVPPLVAVFDGKAEVEIDDRKVNLKKGRQTVLASGAKAEKFDRDHDETGDLYAWSNVRSQYEAAASYRISQSASLGMLGGSGYGLGPGTFGSGWYWDSGFSSYAWLPGSGAFYSPFGYGFYSPGLVGYAPVVVAPIYGRGRYNGGNRPGDGRRWDGNRGNRPPGSNGWRGGAGTPSPGGTMTVPVRPPGGWNGGDRGSWRNGNPGGGAGSWRNNPGAGSWRNGNPGGGGSWRGNPGGNPGGGGARPGFSGGGGGGPRFSGGMRGGGGGGASGGGMRSGGGGPRSK